MYSTHEMGKTQIACIGIHNGKHLKKIINFNCQTFVLMNTTEIFVKLYYTARKFARYPTSA